jgi:hypothetical protein
LLVTNIVPQSTAFGVNVGLGAPQKTMFEKIQSIPNPFAGYNALEQAELAGMTSAALSPQEQAQSLLDRPAPINAGKPLDVDQTKTGMLNVKVPDSFMDKVKRRQLFTQ